MKNKNLIFIPVYNNEKQIKNVLEDLKKLSLSKIDTILFIDNDSIDTTRDIIKKEIKNINIKIVLIHNLKNIGLGGSFKVAINYALTNNFKFIFHYHGNNMNSIGDLITILAKPEYKKFDFYFGSRFERGSKITNYSFFKKIGNLFFNLLYSIFLKTKITDLGGSINVYKISNFKDKLFENFSNDLTFQYYLILYAIYFKKKFKFFPLKIRINHKSNVVVVTHIISMIKIFFNLIIKRNSFFFDR